jgi:hypothetical protein
MSNLITDGFDWMPGGLGFAERTRLFTANEMFGYTSGFADVVVPSPVTGRFGFGNAIRLVGSSGGGVNQFYAMPLGSDETELYMGIAAYFDDSNSITASSFVGFFDAVGNHFQVTVELARYGVINVYRGPTNPDNPWGTRTLIGHSRMGSFENNQWFYLEVYCKLHATTGAVEVRCNTVTKVSLVNVNTIGSVFVSTADSFALGWLSSGAPGHWDASWDDLYVNNTAGSTCNSWLGNQRVKTQFAIADSSPQNFTIGGTSPASTHWQSVLNQNLDDTKYVFSPTLNDEDFYVFDPNLNSPLVNVLQVRSALRQDDSTQRGAKHEIKIGATKYTNTVQHYTNQTYTFYKSRWETNPSTGVGFTGSEVNGLTGAGIKVTL